MLKSSSAKPSVVRMVDGLPCPVPPAGRDWITVNELATALEVRQQRVRSWISVGVSVGEIGTRRRVRLARVGVGREIRIYPDAVLAFLRQTSLPPCEASEPAPMEGDEQKAARYDAACAELREAGMMD